MLPVICRDRSDKTQIPAGQNLGNKFIDSDGGKLDPECLPKTGNGQPFPERGDKRCMDPWNPDGNWRSMPRLP